MGQRRGQTRDRVRLFQPRLEQRLCLSSCTLLLLSQNVTRQGMSLPGAHMPFASALTVLACCPALLVTTNNRCLDKRLNQVVDSSWFLNRKKKTTTTKQWKCLRWRVGCYYACTLFLHLLHMIITMMLHNTGLQGFSCPSSPGPSCYFFHSFVAFWLMLNCKTLVAGTTSLMYQHNASDNGALAAMGAFGSTCHRNDRRE